MTESGIVMLVRLSQYANADSPMLVTESPRLALSRELHKANAISSMYVTESGIVRLTRLWQSAKASLPMQVTVSPFVSTSALLVFGIVSSLPVQEPMPETSQVVSLVFVNERPFSGDTDSGSSLQLTRRANDETTLP